MDGALASWIKQFTWSFGRLDADSHTFEWAVSMGYVTGVERLRFSSNSGSDALEAVVGSSYAFPTGDGTASVVSTSANDNGNLSLAGAWTVRIWWLNAAGTEAAEDVTLNGVGAVNTVANTIRRINRVRVLTADPAVGSNVGTISIRHSLSANAHSYIYAGDGEDDRMVQTVPAGCVDRITDVNSGYSLVGATDDHVFRLYVRESTSAPWVCKATWGWNTPCRHFDYPVMISAGSDYYVAHQSTNYGYVTVEGFRETLP